jgi:hypothetical protein
MTRRPKQPPGRDFRTGRGGDPAGQSLAGRWQPHDAALGVILYLFSFGCYDASMTADLRPATADEIAAALSFALRYRGRKRVFDADDMMAQITAERLVQHLEASGFVVMKKPPIAAPHTSNMPPSVG